jgi:uncharacterized protein YjiS (DUF1127 family)
MFETLKTRYSAYKRYSRTVLELQQLTVRELNDLGISPWDIKRVAKEASR